MRSAKVAVTLDETLLRQVDRLVHRGVFPTRSRVIQEAVVEKLARLGRSRLAGECAKLDPREEQGMADLGLGSEVAEWPEY